MGRTTDSQLSLTLLICVMFKKMRKMKKTNLAAIPLAILLVSCGHKADNSVAEVKEDSVMTAPKYLFMDVHNLGPGKVTPEAVAEAHRKDLAVQGKYGVNLLKYWLDEKEGKVYCLAETSDSASLANTHNEAHGLIPDRVYRVTDGPEANIHDGKKLFLDIHKLGPGNVTTKAVAEAHEKDLATQGKYGVNFVNYWVDEKLGIVMCLAESPDAQTMINAHKEAHGLIPDEVHKVEQGN